MVRILICGDLRGQLQQLCQQVAKLQAKLSEDQHFQAVFCVGEVSSEEPWPDIQPSVPIHFIDCGPKAAKLIADTPQGCEMRPRVHYLGHYGVAHVAGLRVAFLSGRCNEELFNAPEAAPTGGSWEDLREAEKRAERGRTELFVDGCYTPLAVERLKEEIADAGGVDLLLTSEWPSGCLRGVPKEAREGLGDKALLQRCSSLAVADLAAAAEAKYHIVGLAGCFWRRPPWTHVRRGEVLPATGELKCGVCRIISLGALGGGGDKPQKWLHGLDIDPEAPPAPAADATLSPWGIEEPAPVAEHSSAQRAPILDDSEQRRWIQRFGVLPAEMQSAAQKLEQEAQPKDKDKKQKRQSLYYNQKGEKRFKAGKGSNEGFLQKERRAANGKSVASYF